MWSMTTMDRITGSKIASAEETITSNTLQLNVAQYGRTHLKIRMSNWKLRIAPESSPSNRL